MSSNDTILPDDDRDLDLARRIGAALDNRQAPQDPLSPDEPLSDSLRLFKDEQHATEAQVPDAATSARLWEGIEEHLTPAAPARRPREDRGARPGRTATPMRLVPRSWVAVAAVILVLVTLNWLIMPSSRAVLLAEAGDTITTYETLDGTVVTLRPHSRLYALRETAGEQTYRLEGEGYFDVVRNPERVFAVEANQARVAVLGTAFNLSGWGTQTTVFLETGSVRFEHRFDTTQTVFLAPGQQSTMLADGTVVTPEADTSDSHTDWMRGEITFEVQPIARVLDELAHHYGVQFDVNDSLLQETLSGRILLTSQEQSLTDLGVAIGGHFEHITGNTYRFVAE